MANRKLSEVATTDSLDSIFVRIGNAVKQITKAKAKTDLGITKLETDVTSINNKLGSNVGVVSFNVVNITGNYWKVNNTVTVTIHFYASSGYIIKEYDNRSAIVLPVGCRPPATVYQSVEAKTLSCVPISGFELSIKPDGSVTITNTTSSSATFAIVSSTITFGVI